MPARGVDTITVPGGVRGWKALAAIGGSRDWAQLLGGARDAAANGHPVPRSVARAIVDERSMLEAFPGWADTYLPAGVPLAEGQTLRLPALAETFDRLIAGGPDAFYTGELAQRWVTALRELGGRITVEDAAAFAPTIDDPIRRTLFGHDVITSPPNTQGFALLRVLGEIERAGLTDPLGRDAGAVATLFREANRVRAIGLADPEVGIGADELIGMPDPGPTGAGAPNAMGDTVGLVVVSGGWAVSLVQSVFEAFGSGVLDPGTGILFQNRGTAFSLDASAAGRFQPGLRPPHTLMPVLIERDHELAAAVASMGGQAQAQIHTQLFLRLLEGRSALETTSLPRWVVGRQDYPDTVDSVNIEADVDRAAADSLAASPLTPRTVHPRWELMGHANVVRTTDDGLDAASDPRSDGSARVVAVAAP
jgi:gamma-glutamyltranspeptidase/glutathione hydrolase